MSGSTVNRLGTRGSDMDLVFVDDDNYTRNNLNSAEPSEGELRCDAILVLGLVQQALQKMPFVQTISFIHARQPILKLDLNLPYDGMRIDIGYNKIGVYNSHLLRYFSRVDTRFLEMVTFLKMWATHEDVKVVDPHSGMLSSYVLTLMVVHFLQCGISPPILPNLFKRFPSVFFAYTNECPVRDLRYDLKLRIVSKAFPKSDRYLVELLYTFFNYYGNHFDYGNYGISIYHGRLFPRANIPQHAKYKFFLEEPYQHLKLPSALRNVKEDCVLGDIVTKFREAANALMGYIATGELSSPFWKLILLGGDDDGE